MYNCVIGNLNSEQLVLAQIENPKLFYSLVMKKKSLGEINSFDLCEKFGYFTFYGTQYMILVKS